MASKQWISNKHQYINAIYNHINMSKNEKIFFLGIEYGVLEILLSDNFIDSTQYSRLTSQIEKLYRKLTGRALWNPLLL